MKKIEFTEEQKLEIIELFKNGIVSNEIAKRFLVSKNTILRLLKSLNIDTMGLAKVGDIINGWRIDEIFFEPLAGQQVRMANISSTLDEQKKKVRLSCLTNKAIGSPIRKRPDNILRNKTHGESKDRLYRIWNGMKNRCNNKNQYNYINYGAKGITICDEWMVYENFSNWAKLNGYSDNLSLDRIDVDGNYEPLNCKWSTKYEQASNKTYSINFDIKAFGETKSIYEWFNDSRCVLKNILTLRHRIHAGWEPEKAITLKSQRKKRRDLYEWLKENHPEILAEFANS